MPCCPLRLAARQPRESRNNARPRRLGRWLRVATVGAARRLDCFGLEQLLSAIPDSNDDFVHF
jgi:hypothetical protein